MQYVENGRNVTGNGEPIGGKGLRSDTTRNNKHMQCSVEGKSIDLDVSHSLKGNSALEEDSQNKPITETQQFKRWFGNSKVVNEDGTPMIVYHGTLTKGINALKNPHRYLIFEHLCGFSVW